MTTARKLSLCYAAFPGVNTALRNLSRTVRLTRHFALSSLKPNSPELLFFADYLNNSRPALVIFGAWAPGYQVLLDALHPGTLAAVYWNSSTGQVDISNETATLGMVLEHPRIRYKFFSHEAFAAALQSRGDCFALPDTLPMPAHFVPHRANPMPILSLFCSPNEYRRKNILNTLLAVALQTQPYYLHLNGLSENPDYRRLLDEFKIPYRDWGWMTARQYRRNVAHVDIGLQVSFSESFDYVATDHVARGIPVLVSKMVPALDGLPARVANRLVINNPDDPLELAVKLSALLANPRTRRALGASARRQLLKTNEKNIRRAKTLLTEIL